MIAAVTWQNMVMMLVGALLLYLSIEKDFEPTLLLPMGFGTILVNLPLSSALDQMAGTEMVEGALSMLFRLGIATEILPLLILIAVGAMRLRTSCEPEVFLFGLTAQMGIFLTMGIALLLDSTSMKLLRSG